MNMNILKVKHNHRDQGSREKAMADKSMYIPNNDIQNNIIL